MQENQQKMIKDITNMKKRMKEFSAQTEKIETMLAALLKANDIDYLEEDVIGSDDL